MFLRGKGEKLRGEGVFFGEGFLDFSAFRNFEFSAFRVFEFSSSGWNIRMGFGEERREFGDGEKEKTPHRGL